MKRIVATCAAWLVTASLVSGQRARVETVALDSAAVGREMKYQVVLPAGYDEDDDRRFPVLYLLHGYGGNYRDWTRALGVPTYALGYELIVVAPDAGNSRYVNWAESAEGQTNRWEDYIIEEVVGHVDSRYRTVARREGRAIHGISMGGFGAVVLGLRHPETFVSIGSSSGTLAYARRLGERLSAGESLSAASSVEEELDRTPDPAIDIDGFESQRERTPRGVPLSTVAEARAHDPFRLVGRVSRHLLPHIVLDCGLEDRWIEDTKEFAQVLLRNDIPFSYLQLPGGHDAAYWIQAVGHTMAIQHEVMMRALDRRPDVQRRPIQDGGR